MTIKTTAAKIAENKVHTTAARQPVKLYGQAQTIENKGTKPKPPGSRGVTNRKIR